MTLIRDLEDLPSAAQGGAVSVGNFDGVHLGHAGLLAALRQRADEVGGPAVVLTFDPHPAALLRPGSEPIPLTTLERRAELLSRQGVDYVVICRTTADLLQLTAEEFFQQILVDRLGCRAIVEGPNFFFGRDRRGNVSLLREWCEAAQILFQVADGAFTGHQRETDTPTMISSTSIRQLLMRGEIIQANEILTAPYQLAGVVEHGDGRGRQLGFPTANLGGIQTLIPATGVYATSVSIAGTEHASATHIGPNLTFAEDGGVKVETHLVGYSGDLYGRSLRVDFLGRLREITKFASVTELIAQMERDIEAARNWVRYPKQI